MVPSIDIIADSGLTTILTGSSPSKVERLGRLNNTLIDPFFIDGTLKSC